MSIMLIASDLDGTLLRDNKMLSELNRNVIEETISRGIHFVPATGRSFEAIPEEIKTFPGIEYIIINNGAAIYSVSRQSRIYSCILTEEAVDAILAIPVCPGTAMETYINGVSYGDADYVGNPEKYGSTVYGAEYVKATRHPVADIRTFIYEHRRELDGISFLSKNTQTREVLREQILQIKDIYLTSSVDHILEIGHKNAGKGKTLRVLLDMLGISLEEVMTFGDADNDKEMLEQAAYGIAMKNAAESCKKVAYAVTDSNELDGVGKMIQKLLLDREK